MTVALFFYMFAAFLLISALLVVSARNPVHAALFLILAFFNGSGLFLLAGAEFLSMLLLIVYVGAVMVLFLFVVMMLDIDTSELRASMATYLPTGLAVTIVLVTELVLVFSTWASAPGALKLRAAPMPAGLSNTEALGRVLYTDYVYYFEMAGLVLLVAMIGAIVLSLHHRKDVRRQKPAEQSARRRKEASKLVDVKPGEGLSS